MSILIKGMEMPKCCAECEWHEYYGGDYDWVHACRRTGTMPIENAETERANDCPLIEVPTPHGRLGDLDELEKQFKRAIGTYLPKDPTRHMDIVNGSECRGWTQGLTAVKEAKTVIKAED